MSKPSTKPNNPNFSSGPCAKRPGWTVEALKDALVGRSHRSKPGKARIKECIDLSKSILGIPDDYLVGIVPGSDTGAIEMAMWSMLGARGVDVLVWESFSKDWLTDIGKHLRLDDFRVFDAEYGKLPDVSKVDASSRDVVFVWNGTTSGVKVPHANWIPDDRAGLTFCDATSAVFAMDIPWEKLDVVTYSWQKVLGGEAAHGVLVLSPRAVKRLEDYTPSQRPLPKLFRMVKDGQINGDIFEGATINTPSMICVEDAIDSMKWAESIGGLEALIERSNANLGAFEHWVETSDWVDFLAEKKEIRSNTSICFKIVDPDYLALSEADQASVAKSIGTLLDQEGIAYDIGAYRDAPAGLRVWGGATVETSDIEALIPWLDWAYANLKQQFKKAA